MFGGQDLDAADRWVDDWQAGIDAQAARAKELSGHLAQISGSARSEDGLVEVTVGPSGVVTALTLDEDIRDQPAEQTARDILATMRAAQAALTARASEAVAETVGVDTATGQAILATFTARHTAAEDDERG
jgi:DNA-binding protein YbaB